MRDLVTVNMSKTCGQPDAESLIFIFQAQCGVFYMVPILSTLEG